jgi:hypothetical protein
MVPVLPVKKAESFTVREFLEYVFVMTPGVPALPFALLTVIDFVAVFCTPPIVYTAVIVADPTPTPVKTFLAISC